MKKKQGFTQGIEDHLSSRFLQDFSLLGLSCLIKHMDTDRMHWLDRYGTKYHRWQQLHNSSAETWYRPVGLVEGLFDRDSMDGEGIADVNTLLGAQLSAHLEPEVLRRKILLAWAVLRFEHVLLSARALCREDFLPGGAGCAGSAKDRFFVVERPGGLDEMVREASRTIDFVQDHYHEVDVEDFYTHVMNTARVFDNSKNLARLFILPLKSTSDGRFLFQAISVVAHEIADALTIYRWHARFLDLLNTPISVLEKRAAQLCFASSSDLESRLPPAQEDLYPPITGNRARQRWFWAISRILRHVRRPPPPSFPNPLCRKTRLKSAEKLPRHYPALLDYSKTPPLNTYSVSASLSPRAASRIQSLCRSANVSIGSGTFALVALVMMKLYEQQQQQQPTTQPNLESPPAPFVASFPLNTRPFLTQPTTGQECSLVLAFSDGLTLPFLPSTLPLEGRFRLLARQAHRQLRIYQKRKREPENAGAQTLREPSSSRSAAQMLPQLYLYSTERAMGGETVQGNYPPNMGRGGGEASASPGGEVVGMRATCGVSSIGDRTELIAPLPPAHASAEGGKVGDEGEEGYAFFSFTDIDCTVRAREGEFLVGSAGERGTGWLGFSVSFDGCAIDRSRVQAEWRVLMETLFEVEHGDEGKESQESIRAERKGARGGGGGGGGGGAEKMRKAKSSVMAKL